MCQSVEVLRALPENSDDEDVAVDDDENRKYEEDRQLVPGEDDALSTLVDVVVGTRRHDDVVVAVVEQALHRLLFNTRKHVLHGSVYGFTYCNVMSLNVILCV